MRGRTARRLSLALATIGAFTGLAMALFALSAAAASPSADGESVEPAAQGPAEGGNGVAAREASGFILDGALTQGGWLRGTAPVGTISLSLAGSPLALDGERLFFAGFDRDASGDAELVATLQNGRQIVREVPVSPRAWNIEHINAARRAGGPTEAFMTRRAPELARINAARQANAPSLGWTQDFIWPATGRISGRFGSQRIYRGEAGSYHSGLDIATGASGTPFVAPADGVVVLAAEEPFTLEGYLLIIDHGNGLNSAFLHASKLVVREGDRVHQGQHIGNIGATGRATGPHLHWSIKWRDARLDPLLFLGPMP